MVLLIDHLKREGTMNDISVIGLDIAKTVFHACVMDKAGRVIERKRLYREHVLSYFRGFKPCLVALESCGGSSYWARELSKLGFKVRLISAQYVKPFAKGQKNDVVDAEAICEAALRPEMRYVSPNTLTQQDIQNIHRVRDRLVKQKLMLSNQIRGLLLEYGITIPRRTDKLIELLEDIVIQDKNSSRELWRVVFLDLKQELDEINLKIKHYDKIIKQISTSHPVCQRLEQMWGVGPLTSTAILAAVGNPHDFKNGRQFSAWLGLVPKQNSTGGKTKLLGITKTGNRYLRRLLVHGARIEIRFANKRGNTWLLELKQRRGYNKAAVALANKNARRLWVLLTSEQEYQAI
jgi:transposase